MIYPNWLGKTGDGEVIIKEKRVEIPIYSTEYMYIKQPNPKININMIDIIHIKVNNRKKNIIIRSYPI